MNPSVKCEYALRALVDLTISSNGQPVKIADIATRRRIPQKFLELILAELKRLGFVESKRGAEGGYLLARDPGSITSGQVVRGIEGGRSTRSDTDSHTPLGGLWTRVDEAISGVLDKTSVAELAREWQQNQTRYVANWDI